MEDIKSVLAKKMELEISDYLTKVVSVSIDNDFSQHKLVRRISLFENHIYPTGKFDKQGNYKYWYDIQTPRIDSEVKNIDFDTKNITAYSPADVDEVPSIITNLKLIEYMRETGQAEEFNSAIEEGSGWGNVVWKKVKGSYERVDLKNFYVINQTAEDLSKSTAIERHQMTQSELRETGAGWKNIDEIIKSGGKNLFKSNVDSTQQDVTVPIYSVYERNGEVNVKDLKEWQGETVLDGDEFKVTFAKVIGVGTEGTRAGVKIKWIVFAKDLGGMNNSDIYQEYHRGRYKGRWMREGLYELLFDYEVRANEIGNQIAQGLQYASKVIFTGEDKQIIQNVITDLKNGDYLKGKDLKQVEVRMNGFDQLMADWNRNLQEADSVANSREIVQGITPASGTPLGTSQLLNTNANKLYDFLREKLTIPLTVLMEKWIVPDLIKDIKTQEVLRLTGDSKMMARLRELVVESWYIKNLVKIGSHSKEIADTMKQQKLEEISKDEALFLKEVRKSFEGFKTRVSIVITGENTKRLEERDSFIQFIPMVEDPIRRNAMIEEAMRRSSIDIGGLPKSTDEQLARQQAPTEQPKQPTKQPVSNATR